jgi:hypothetical protein
MSRRRPQRRVRPKERAARGAPREAGVGGASGWKGPEDWVMKVRRWGRRWGGEGYGEGGDGLLQRWRYRLREGIAGLGCVSRIGARGVRLAPAMPRRHMLAVRWLG